MSSTASSSPTRSRRHVPSFAKSALQPAPLSTSVIHYADPFLPIDRAAKALERNIQSFLDGQSAGLSVGLGSTSQEDFSSNGSLTPTPSASTPPGISGPRTVPLRQPQHNKITLKGARRGIARSMKELVILKEQEIKVLDGQQRKREKAIQSVEVFEEKKVGLETQIAEIQNASDNKNASDLKADAEQLESEIRQLEDEIAEKKARHQHLINQANQTASSVQSKLSSFEASMKMLDSDIKEFLKRPPIEQSLHTMASNAAPGLYALNPKRRTLNMAKEHWLDEEESLSNRKHDVEVEMNALKEGSVMWRAVVSEINSFEDWLQHETGHLSKNVGHNDMSAVLQRMGDIIQTLEQRFEVAEDNGWNLLVCSIGAELEAYREGKVLLSQTFGLVQGDVGDKDQGTPEEDLPRNGGMMHGSNESLKATMFEMSLDEGKEEASHAAASHSSVADQHSESEDDGPGADFLISHDD